MRILLLSENFPPKKGGSATWLLHLYTRLARHEVSFAASDWPGHERFDAGFSHSVERIAMTLKERDPTSARALEPYLRIFLRLARLCRRDGIEQLHCGKVLPEGFLGLALRRILGIPYVLYCHGEEITTTSSSRRYRWLVPLVYRNAAGVIANAENTKRLLREIGVEEERIHVIHPSVPAEEFDEAALQGRRIREKHGLRDELVLLTVGRLQRRKGHDKVIEALPKIREYFPRTRYVIAGGGEERERLEELARSHGVEEHVVFAGLVPDEELPGYYGACDVFLMPNRDVEGDFEGFGIVFLEASASGKPVIGGRSGGATEAVSEGVSGLLVDGTSADEIAAAVCALLGEPQRARALGASGRARVVREFGYREAASDLERLIDTTPGKPTKARGPGPTGRRTCTPAGR